MSGGVGFDPGDDGTPRPRRAVLAFAGGVVVGAVGVVVFLVALRYGG